MTQYTVTAERSGQWWSLQCVEVPGAISQVARLGQADQIREAIAFVAGVDEDDVEIDLIVNLPEQAQRHLAASRELRDQASVAAVGAASEARAAAHELRAAGLTTRDIGVVMGVSFQRVHQLLTEQTRREVEA